MCDLNPGGNPSRRIRLDTLANLPREGAGIDSGHSRKQGYLRGHCVYAGNKFSYLHSSAADHHRPSVGTPDDSSPLAGFSFKSPDDELLVLHGRPFVGPSPAELVIVPKGN